MNYNPRDLLAAGPDALLAAFGTPARNPHPLVSELSAAPLSRLAHAAGLTVRPQQPHENDAAVMARGMNSRDFGALLASAATTLANRRFDTLAEHRTFCAVVEARDFRPTSFATTDVDGELPLAPEGAEIVSGRVVVGGGTEAQLKTFATIQRASRSLIVNDQSAIFADAVAQLGTAGARTEAREVYAALEADLTLDDGELVFHADHGNVIASAFDAAALGHAMAALRNATLIGGNAADLPAAHLVVAADLELAARKVVHEAGLELSVTATARLPNGRWYLLPSPDVAPTIVVLQLRGTANSILIEPWQDEFAFDGAVLRARCDTGAALVARTLIRGGA